MINPYRVGKTVLFQVTYDRDWHLFEAIPFFFISVFGVGLIAIMDCRYPYGIYMKLTSRLIIMLPILLFIGRLWRHFFTIPHVVLSLQIQDMDRAAPGSGSIDCDPVNMRHTVVESMDKGQPVAIADEPLQRMHARKQFEWDVRVSRAKCISNNTEQPVHGLSELAF